MFLPRAIFSARSSTVLPSCVSSSRVRFIRSSMSTPSDDRRWAMRILGTGKIAGRCGSNSGNRSFARSTRRLILPSVGFTITKV